MCKFKTFFQELDELTYIFNNEFVVLSVAYKISSCTFEKYNPVISGQSATCISSSTVPS
jgi:hypothetical protein